MRRFMHSGSLVVVALLLAGCTSSVIGAGRPDPEVLAELQRQRDLEATPLTAEAALGDFTTVDYCSLVDVSDLGEVMTVEGDARQSFDYCEVAGKAQENPIRVRVGPLGEAANLGRGAQDPNKELPRGLILERVPVHPVQCDLHLVFADDHRLQSTAISHAVEPGGTGAISEEQLCLAAEKALDSVVAAVTGPDPARHFTFADNSLGTLVACGDGSAVLESAQVASALRVPSVETVDSPGGHHCRWQADDHMVTLYFDVAQASSSGGTSEMIAGRETSVLASGDFCIVETVHAPFAEAGAGESEIVYLYVQTPGSSHACAAGRALAKSAWAKLPPR